MPLVKHCIDLEEEIISLRTMERLEHTFTQLNMVESFVVKEQNILNEKDIKKLLPMKDQNSAFQYMESVKNGSVTVVNNTPIVNHRLFAEYFASFWINCNLNWNSKCYRS